MECMKTAICSECTHKISGYGEACSDAIIVACFGMTENELAKFNPENDPVANKAIQFLESKGYLISSEMSKKEIAFMPTCEPTLVEEDMLGYCWCK